MRGNTKFHTKKGLLFTASLSEQHTKRTNLVVATVGETAGDVGSMTIYNNRRTWNKKRRLERLERRKRSIQNENASSAVQYELRKPAKQNPIKKSHSNDFARPNSRFSFRSGRTIDWPLIVETK